MKINEDISEYMSQLGKKGGKALFAKRGVAFMKEISKKAAEARKKKSNGTKS